MARLRFTRRTATVATLSMLAVDRASAADINAFARRGLDAADWQQRLSDNAAPTTTTVVRVVRKGNPLAGNRRASCH